MPSKIYFFDSARKATRIIENKKGTVVKYIVLGEIVSMLKVHYAIVLYLQTPLMGLL